MKFLRFWFPVLFYSGIIFYASGVPHLKTPLPDLPVDKVLHILEFVPFGFLVARALAESKIKGIWLFSIGISLLYGISDEWHQSFVAGRTASISDIIADTIGGLLGSWVFLKIRKENDDTN